MKDESGQVLIEMIAAMAVTLLLVTGIFIWISYGVRNARLSQNQTLAGKYGEQIMESIRDYRDSVVWDDFCNNCGSLLSHVPTPPSPFQAVVPCVCQNDAATITVTVSWTEAGQTYKSVNSSIFSKWKEK